MAGLEWAARTAKYERPCDGCMEAGGQTRGMRVLVFIAGYRVAGLCRECWNTWKNSWEAAGGSVGKLRRGEK